MPKTLWDISRQKERSSVYEIYSLIMLEAQKYRDEQKKSYPGDISYREHCQDMSSALFQVCAALENTEEINPTKK